MKILKSAKRSFLIVDEDGTNSKKLAQRLKKDGFIQAIYLKGGFDNWKNNNTK